MVTEVINMVKPPCLIKYYQYPSKFEAHNILNFHMFKYIFLMQQQQYGFATYRETM